MNNNIFETQNKLNQINAQPIGNSMNVNVPNSSFPLAKMVFEKNRYLKNVVGDDKVLYYFVGFVNFKTPDKKTDNVHKQLLNTKDAYCLCGFSRKHLYVQFYDLNGNLSWSFTFKHRDFISVTNTYMLGITTIVLNLNKKESLTIMVYDDLNDFQFPLFFEKNQTNIMNEVRKGLKNGDIFS